MSFLSFVVTLYVPEYCFQYWYINLAARENKKFHYLTDTFLQEINPPRVVPSQYQQHCNTYTLKTRTPAD
jgi:hypothetical protein